MTLVWACSRSFLQTERITREDVGCPYVGIPVRVAGSILSCENSSCPLCWHPCSSSRSNPAVCQNVARGFTLPLRLLLLGSPGVPGRCPRILCNLWSRLILSAFATRSSFCLLLVFLQIRFVVFLSWSVLSFWDVCSCTFVFVFTCSDSGWLSKRRFSGCWHLAPRAFFQGGHKKDGDANGSYVVCGCSFQPFVGSGAGLSTDATTWLILPVVICLSQRLSHACVSMNYFIR